MLALSKLKRDKEQHSTVQLDKDNSSEHKASSVSFAPAKALKVSVVLGYSMLYWVEYSE